MSLINLLCPKESGYSFILRGCHIYLARDLQKCCESNLIYTDCRSNLFGSYYQE